MADTVLTPPIATKKPHITQLHGREMTDNYYWLREKKTKEVVDYLEAENAYTAAQLKHTEDLQKKLYEEFLSRIKQTDEDVPYPYGPYYYYTRTVEGQQYSIRCRKAGSLDAPEEIILDENVLAEGLEYSSLGITGISPNHKLYAYNHDKEGDEKYTLYIKDLETGKLLSDVIPNTYYSFEWANDNKTFFYTILDHACRSFKVFRHTLGCEEETLIMHEEDEKFSLDIEKTEDDKYLLMTSNSSTTSEVWILDADNPLGKWEVFVPRSKGIEYSITHQNDRFFITTNEDGATNFKLMEVLRSEVEFGTRKNWKQVGEYDPLVKLDSITVFKNYTVYWERRNGLTSMRVKRLSDNNITLVTFSEPVYVVRESVNANYDTNIVRISYQSMVTPKSTIDYNMDTNEQTLKKQEEVLGGYDKSEYQSEAIFATAKDGTRVPMSIVYKKALWKRDGTCPMLLYGYGSYGYTVEPTFNSNRLSFLERGMAYVIAHIRGGGAMGRPWYDAGKVLTKRNTFTDFIACAQHLVDEKYTSSDRLATMGASAGGLLMGAVANMAPHLFHSVVADVPFVDAINTMLDETIPLTVGEFEEWGNPKELEAFEYMLSYSPYDNIEAKDYPKMLFIAAWNDPRVQYWEPAKMVAKLRATKTGNSTLLLRTFMEEGHAGASGRYDSLKETAFTYGFILDSLGFTK